jgi:uncharacterized protein YutE (UPF0331/DUF86 family)
VPEFRYAKGRILESVQFVSEEMREFETEYAETTWKGYQDDRKLQKLMDRTVENILTAIIEVSGTILTEEGIRVTSYADALIKCTRLIGFSEEEQERLSKLAVQRNRLAHRYLNFRWQAVKMFAEERGLVARLMERILEREEKKEFE